MFFFLSSFREFCTLGGWSERGTEEGSDGRGQVAGDRLDVVEELPAVGALDDGDPEDADDDQEHHKHSAGEHRAL